jgi:hypothetical protein
MRPIGTEQLYSLYLHHLLLTLGIVVTFDLEARSMELLFTVFSTFLSILVDVFAVVFFCLQQRWFQFVHGDAQQQKEKSVILPLFWASRPAAWFGFARRRWFLRQRRFDLLLAAMPEKILVMNIVENMPEDYPHDTRLLETHTLSDLEKMGILFKSQALGGRKPSQMLVNMLAYCPFGMEQSVMFQYMFLQRLSVTLRTLLVGTGAW